MYNHQNRTNRPVFLFEFFNQRNKFVLIANTIVMSYYNYHAMAKNLIKNKHCLGATIFKEYHHIYPALVLYFDVHKPIPIREYMWLDYFEILKEFNITISNPDNISSNYQ